MKNLTDFRKTVETGVDPRLFPALLGDRFSYSYFPFNRRSENRAQVASRASLGKPIVSIEAERRPSVNLYRISMQKGIFT